MNSLTTKLAVLLATAKQMPWAPAIIAVLMPTTSPREETSGPPELPGLSAASVWITSSISRPVAARSDRPSADTTPAVTVDSKPSGLPIATTSWPRRSALGVAEPCRRQGAVGRRCAARRGRCRDRRPARAPRRCAPSASASRTRGGAARRRGCWSGPGRRARSTTPEPVPPRWRFSRSGGVSTRTTAGPTRSTTSTTARE